MNSNDIGIAEARNRLREKAQNEATCIALNNMLKDAQNQIELLREENEYLRATQPQQSPWQPIVTPIENGRRVIVASSNRMALFHGQFRKYPFPRIVANDGSYITEFYAWMYEPELPPLPEPAP